MRDGNCTVTLLACLSKRKEEGREKASRLDLPLTARDRASHPTIRPTYEHAARNSGPINSFFLPSLAVRPSASVRPSGSLSAQRVYVVLPRGGGEPGVYYTDHPIVLALHLPYVVEGSAQQGVPYITKLVFVF